MKLKKSACVILGAGIIAASVSGCGGNDVGKTAQSQTSDLPKGEISYPIETDTTLTYWVRLAASLGTSVKNFGETPFAQEYMKRTGIKVEYQHPAQGQEREALNLLVASNDLPDIIESNWLERDPDSVIAKGTIRSLNSYFDYSPNLKKYLEENPDIDKAVKTDTGNYYVYPFIRDDEKLLSTAGLILRSDWLREAGLEVPETIDEWDQVLAAFKEKCDSPLAMTVDGLYRYLPAYNLDPEFIIDDSGEIVYGSIQPAFKDWLTKMNEWYQKGYIDKNFAILDTKLINANMLDGNSGVVFGAGGGSMGMYLNAKKDTDPTYDLAAAPFPAPAKGVRPMFGNKQPTYSPLNGGAITGKCEVPELAARFLDYSYSEEGYMLNNFGIEGESYVMEDGYPKYTEVITNNPDGLSMAQAMPLYIRAANEGPFVQDVRYIEQYYSLPQQQNALDVWSANDHEKHVMPQLTLTQDETNQYSRIMSDITTYRDESVVAFILGTKPIDEFDAYVEQIKSLGIDQATEIQKNAYDRFQKR